jgi:capsular exopolysaccharide synthesis family protein
MKAMEPAPLELRDYLFILWRQRWMVLAVAGVSVASALFYASRQTPVYSSSAEVIVRPARFDPNQPRAAFGFQNMITEQRVANSSEVASRAIDTLQAAGIAPGYVSAAQTEEESETLLFTAVAPNPAAAQASANAWAESYLELRRDQFLRDLNTSRQPYDERIATIDAQLEAIADELESTDDDTERTLLNARYVSLLEERSAVVQQSNELISPQSVQVGEVLQPATFPTSPDGSSPLTTGGLALLVGFSLGAGLAYLRDRLDQRVRGRDDLEVHAGAPVIAYIPTGTPLKDGLPVTASDHASEIAEAYTTLGLRLVRAADQGRFRTLLVTSSLSGEGKTSIAANLGVALARSGKRVAVVSADLRRPGLEAYFSLRNGTGLRDVLNGRRMILEVVTPTRITGLWVVPGGGQPGTSSPLELLSSDAMKAALTDLRYLVEYVIIDTTPLLGSFDATALATFADGVLFVADARKASRTTIEHGRRELQTTGASLVGVVVNRYDPRTFESYGYGWYKADAHRARTSITAGDERNQQGFQPDTES